MKHLQHGDGSGGPARKFGEFLRAIMVALVNGEPGEVVETLVPCRRRPGRRPCPGKIQGSVTSDFDIRWECPACGDCGVITCGAGRSWDGR